MPVPPERFSQLRWLHNLACLLAVIGSVVLMGLGLLEYGGSTSLWLFVAGGFILFIAVMLMTITPLLVKMEATFARQLGELVALRQAVSKQSEELQTIVENTRISDAAKSLAHRNQEFEALQKAIREDLHAKRWEAALGLIDEIEQRFGFKQEADTLREELDDARRDAIDHRLTQAIELIESQFKAHDWVHAQSEIDRLARALPGDVRVHGLQDRMKVLQEQHKQELKIAWDEAVRRSDTDHAIDVLKELDQYLSPAEAHALQESARHVFKEKLVQLGVQFRFAVNEKRWQDALDIGLNLIREFPNARMAAEVRQAIDTLREKAAQTTRPLPTQTTQT